MHVDGNIDPVLLRNLDECFQGCYRVLIADTPVVALRGLDYRSFDNSISFITTRSFKH